MENFIMKINLGQGSIFITFWSAWWFIGYVNLSTQMSQVKFFLFMVAFDYFIFLFDYRDILFSACFFLIKDT